MPNKEKLKSMLTTLHILKTARIKLISDFVNREQDIYLPMFKHENHHILMNIALESYFTSWVNYHFQLLDKHYGNKSDNIFLEVMKNMIEIILPSIGEINPYNKEFISNLIASKINLLKKMIKTGENDDVKYCSLLLEYEKDKALFKREIDRLEEEA